MYSESMSYVKRNGLRDCQAVDIELESEVVLRQGEGEQWHHDNTVRVRAITQQRQSNLSTTDGTWFSAPQLQRVEIKLYQMLWRGIFYIPQFDFDLTVSTPFHSILVEAFKLFPLPVNRQLIDCQ